MPEGQELPPGPGLELPDVKGCLLGPGLELPDGQDLLPGPGLVHHHQQPVLVHDLLQLGLAGLLPPGFS
jgi:hypothetical protein